MSQIYQISYEIVMIPFEMEIKGMIRIWTEMWTEKIYEVRQLWTSGGTVAVVDFIDSIYQMPITLAKSYFNLVL